MRKLHIDIETRSALDLRDYGTPVYAADPSTLILMAAYAFDDEPVQHWDCTRVSRMPADLAEALVSPDVLKLAWNAPFEMALIASCWDIPTPEEQWACVMAAVRSLTLPASLDAAGNVLGLPVNQAKAKIGKRLIDLFCKPHVVTKKRPDLWRTYETDPEDWLEFCAYNIQDVVAERAILKHVKRLLRYTQTRTEREIWMLDRRINRTGLPIDRDFVLAAADVVDHWTEDQLKWAKRITKLDNPNSRDQLLGWLRLYGYDLPDLTRHTVETLLKRDDLESGIRKVLEIRRDTGQTAVKKFHALAQRTSADGRLRECFIYGGASRTMRWAGGNGFQPQNIPGSTLGGETVEEKQAVLSQAVTRINTRDYKVLERHYGSVIRPLSSTIRAAVAAPRGKRLVVADLSSIESVVLGWLANCGPILDLYRHGRDAYKVFAAEVFGIPYDQVTKPQRKFAKPPVLGCGYGLGGPGLVQYAEGMGVDLAEMWTAEDSERLVANGTVSRPSEFRVEQRREAIGKRLVNIYRTMYPQIPAFWYKLKDAFVAAVTRKSITQVGPLLFVPDGDFLFVRLPSGRHLSYVNPRAEWVEHPEWGRVIEMTYEGMDSMTKQWQLLYIHPGKLAEQATQAVSRDLLAEGLLMAELMGFEIVGHVHDEIITLVDVDSGLTANTLAECMATIPAWAKGAPVKAVGWTGARYLKD